MKLKLSTYLLATICISGISNAVPVNLIDQQHGAGTGSFEQLSDAFVETGNDYMRGYAGNPILSGWTIGGGGVDILREPLHNASDGIYSIDMCSTVGSRGSLETYFPTEIGGTYQLSFNAYGNLHTSSHVGSVSVGDLVNQQFTPAAVASPTTATYEQFNYEFTALAETTVLSIAALSGSTGFGPVIDNVSVYAIPEPATMGMIGLFTCGLYFVRRLFHSV